MVDIIQGAEKGKSVFMTWGLPAIGMAIGFGLGDAIGVGGMIDQALRKYVTNAIDRKRYSLLLASGVYCSVGVLTWKIPLAGKFITGILLGMAIRGAVTAFREAA